MKYVLMAILASSFLGCASMGTSSNEKTTNVIGEVTDDSSTHTTEHEHELKFKNQETGEVLDIVDSPSLVKLHHESEKNLLIEAQVARTPKVLFWGNNLVVKNFRVIKETSDVIPHVYVNTAPARKSPASLRSRIGRDRL